MSRRTHGGGGERSCSGWWQSALLPGPIPSSTGREASGSKQRTESLRRDSKKMTTATMHTTRIRSSSLQLAEPQSKRLKEKKRKMKDREASGSSLWAKRRRAESPESRPSPALRRDGKPMTIPTMHMSWIFRLAFFRSKTFKTRRKANEMSPTPSSPLCQPYIPEDMYDTANTELFTAFRELEDQYLAKSARHMKMPTVEHFSPSCLFDDQELLPIRESGTKVVLCGAKYVIGLSSSIDGEPLRRCSGIWIDWSEESKTGIVLTTARLILSKEPSFDQWLGKDEYSPDVKVNIHLLDDTSPEGRLIYCNRHYDLALFLVKIDQSVQVPTFSDTVNCAQEVFRLGRDKRLDLKIAHGRVEFANPNVFERYHYMFFSHKEDEYEVNPSVPVWVEAFRYQASRPCPYREDMAQVKN